MKSKITVTAGYLYQRGRWEIFLHEGKQPIKNSPLFWPILPDFTGKRFEKEVEKLAEELNRYGVTKEQIEEAILEECRREDIKPPKYLR